MNIAHRMNSFKCKQFVNKQNGKYLVKEEFLDKNVVLDFL